MDRLFRQSGLMRPKWDEKHFSDGRTYGQNTIDKAVLGCREVYTSTVGVQGERRSYLSSRGKMPVYTTFTEGEVSFLPGEKAPNDVHHVHHVYLLSDGDSVEQLAAALSTVWTLDNQKELR